VPSAQWRGTHRIILNFYILKAMVLMAENRLLWPVTDSQLKRQIHGVENSNIAFIACLFFYWFVLFHNADRR
jgi:hypothetical protein